MSMINEFVEKLIDRLEELKKVEFDREDYSDNHDYYDDWEYAFGDGASDGRYYAYGRSIKIIKELAEEYKDVPDTNVGKNLSENLIEKIKFVIEASNTNDDYATGLRNGMRYCLALIDGKKPEFESCKQGWIPVSEKLPENTDPVNITWVNHNPETYYADIKDKPFTDTGCYCDGKWYWYSILCQDYLDEYRYSENDYMDNGIEVIAWQPLPQSYKGE